MVSEHFAMQITENVNKVLCCSDFLCPFNYVNKLCKSGLIRRDSGLINRLNGGFQIFCTITLKHV